MPVDIPIKGRGQSKRLSRFCRPRRARGIHPKHGYIIGGVCDQIHQGRRNRELGALEMADLLFRQSKRCLEKKGREVKVIGYPKYKSLEYGRLFGADYEIGLLRFSQMVIPLLIKDELWVTRKQLNIYAKQIASFEFGVKMDNPLSILDGTAKFGLAAPHQDYLYKQRIQDGDLE